MGTYPHIDTYIHIIKNNKILPQLCWATPFLLQQRVSIYRCYGRCPVVSLCSTSWSTVSLSKCFNQPFLSLLKTSSKTSWQSPGQCVCVCVGSVSSAWLLSGICFPYNHDDYQGAGHSRSIIPLVKQTSVKMQRSVQNKLVYGKIKKIYRTERTSPFNRLMGDNNLLLYSKRRHVLKFLCFKRQG